MVNLFSECSGDRNKSRLLKFLVDDVEEERRVPSPLHLGDQVTNLLLSLNLFLEVFTFQEVGQLSVIVRISNLVQLKQGLEFQLTKRL